MLETLKLIESQLLNVSNLPLNLLQGTQAINLIDDSSISHLSIHSKKLIIHKGTPYKWNEDAVREIMLMNFYKYFLKNIELSAICFIKMREKSILMMIMFSIHCLNNCARGYRVFSVCVVWLQSKRVNESKYTHVRFKNHYQTAKNSKNTKTFSSFFIFHSSIIGFYLFLFSIIWNTNWCYYYPLFGVWSLRIVRLIAWLVCF